MKRIVTAVEVFVAVVAAIFVVLLFANEPDSGGGGASRLTGAEIYSASCAGCHGADGGGGIGPALAGVVTSEFPDVADQLAVVRDGRGSMPAFDGRLSAQELDDVVEYTRTELGG